MKPLKTFLWVFITLWVFLCVFGAVILDSAHSHATATVVAWGMVGTFFMVAACGMAVIVMEADDRRAAEKLRMDEQRRILGGK